MDDRGEADACGRARTLRVATWNVQSCARGVTGVAAHLASLEADVVALQEIDRGTHRSGRIDQVARLADGAGFAYHAFFRAMEWDDVGAYGLGVVSRVPLLGARTEALPTEGETEPRVLGLVTLETPDGLVGLGVTHLSHRPDEAALRARQAARVCDLLADEKIPVLLAADLNDLPESTTHAVLTARLTDVFDAAGTGEPGTFPLPFEMGAALRLDYLFASRALRPQRARVVPTEASDHHALCASLTLSE